MAASLSSSPVSLLVLLGVLPTLVGATLVTVTNCQGLGGLSSNSLITDLEAAGSVSAGSSSQRRTKAVKRAVSLYWDTDFVRD